MYKYKASVIVLSYNHSSFITDTLKSIEIQSVDSVQIIVGDDCSSDGTQALIKEIVSKSRFDYKVFLNSENLGITKNFNQCLSRCEGEYIFLLGGDDLFLDGKLEKQISFMDSHPDVSISYHDAYIFDSSTGRVFLKYSELFNVKEPSLKNLILYGTFFTGCTPCVRNFKGIPMCNENIRSASDWLWYVEVLLLSSAKIAVIEGVYSKYRRHDQNVTSHKNYMTAYSETIYSLDYIASNYKDYQSLAVRAKSERLFAFSLKALFCGDFRFAINSMLRSVVYNPLAPLLFIALRFNSVFYRMRFK
ncbi:glycosyltransferase [Vibrio cholerae]